MSIPSCHCRKLQVKVTYCSEWNLHQKVFNWFFVLYVSTQLNVHHFNSTINQLGIIVLTFSINQQQKKWSKNRIIKNHFMTSPRLKKNPNICRVSTCCVYLWNASIFSSHDDIFCYLFALIGIKLKLISPSNRICQIWICWFHLLNLHIRQMLISSSEIFLSGFQCKMIIMMLNCSVAFYKPTKCNCFGYRFCWLQRTFVISLRFIQCLYKGSKTQHLKCITLSYVFSKLIRPLDFVSKQINEHLFGWKMSIIVVLNDGLLKIINFFPLTQS